MKKNKLMMKIIHLPQKYRNIPTKSIYTLLKETGYFEAYDQITEEDILNVLVQYPAVINDWISWSADKRCSPSWYFLENEQGKYIVGYFSHRENEKQKIEYSDIKTACAAFIKREIESIRLP